jgi:hypothetical protein
LKEYNLTSVVLAFTSFPSCNIVVTDKLLGAGTDILMDIAFEGECKLFVDFFHFAREPLSGEPSQFS